MTDTELLAKAIDRLAAAVEQAVLARLDAKPADPFPARLEPVEIGDAELAALPPVRPVETSAPSQPAGLCPAHHTPWKLVPAGISKKSGNAYTAFWAC